MNYNPNKPIYLQISDYISDQIMLRRWLEEERIPSIRELSSLLQVNPNTIVKAFEHAEQLGLIYNKRGIGYFVCLDAVKTITELYKNAFFEKVLPEIFKKMQLLKIDFSEIEKKYQSYLDLQK